MSKLLIFEIGVGNIFLSRTAKYWHDKNINFVLIEPNFLLYDHIVKKTKNYENIKVLNVALDSVESIQQFILAGDRSFLCGKPSPIQVIYHNQYEKLMCNFKTFVKTATFDSIDPGNIDILYLSVEGNEWEILQKMISRPKIITLPHYFANDYNYNFPNFDKICQWMNINSYILKTQDCDNFILVYEKS